MDASNASTPVSPRNRQLAGYDEQFREVRRAAHALVDPLTDEQFNWHPAPGRWSIAECLMHLCETGEMYVPLLRDAIREGRRRGKLGEGPFHHGMFGRFFISRIEPPAKVKIPAPKSMTVGIDATRHDKETLLARFDALGRELRSLVAEADGVDLDRVKIPSVVIRLVRMNLGEWFQFIAAHERRHLWQGSNVASERAFPLATGG